MDGCWGSKDLKIGEAAYSMVCLPAHTHTRHTNTHTHTPARPFHCSKPGLGKLEPRPINHHPYPVTDDRV